MSNQYRVAVIGAGRPRGTDGATGFGMSHQHMAGFAATGRAKLVAVADIKRENAEAFIRDHNPEAAIYADYMDMMQKESPDFVSISLWPELHAKVVVDILKHKPRAIHCEKPMDLHWDAALGMHAACKEAGVVLTINHQRRFNKPFQRAKSLIDEGAIGTLQRMEAAWHNLADSGTHWLDMMFFFNNETPAQWVLGQVERRGAKQAFGAWQEGQSVVTFRCENGVRATMYSGKDHADLGCIIRVTGSLGFLEILGAAPWLRLHQFDKPGIVDLDPGEGIHDNAANVRAILDLVESVEKGRTPLLSSDNALRSTEVIFASYQSSQSRGRIDLPLPPGRSALIEMLDADRAATSA